MEKTKFENKSEFRAYCRAKLCQTSNNYKRDKLISDRLITMLSLLKARSILLYIPLAIEADITHVIQFFRRRCKVYVPFMEGISFKMVKYKLPLYKKRFNILEPKNSFAVKPKIDAVIVPVIGVDGAFKRIGFGKGMYDRFFESFSSKPTILFVQREVCFTQTIVSEEHDIEADIYLTPYKTILKRGINGFRVISNRSYRSKWGSRVFHRQKDGVGKLPNTYRTSTRKSKSN
ncbi:MAG: 5-formyltetrahydrofolate cyclo-ligase [Sulfurospirillaceae bacterium]|nr:5-formyltetrahydrofolate cyclo-ligase [Sulfurospirillaceae bacterium]MDD2826070.1 5-formyltetrahydrofolate cyclo-ligase [Sulfurospirillaceae bacterium]